MNDVSAVGLRERKKAETRERIHKAGLRLFAEQGFAATTVAEIAAAADVSPRTVFVHYPTKEDIVFGDLETALVAFEAGLRSRPPGVTVPQAIRCWLEESVGGWLEPDVELQVRLSEEVPSIAQRKVQIGELFRAPLAAALAADLGLTADSLPVGLAAAAMLTGLLRVEALVSESLAAGEGMPPRERLDRVLDEVERFVEAGLRGASA
jgi:AcrR family transcriptional regulator